MTNGKDFKAAKMLRDELERIHNEHAKALKEFEVHKTDSGLTPDHIRMTPEWIKAKSDFTHSFATLRAFNATYVKKYKKEIMKERRNRYQ